MANDHDTWQAYQKAIDDMLPQIRAMLKEERALAGGTEHAAQMGVVDWMSMLPSMTFGRAVSMLTLTMIRLAEQTNAAQEPLNAANEPAIYLGTGWD